MFLGCDQPVILRPRPHGQYILLGNSFVYGLGDAIASLGPLERHWTVQVDYHPESSQRYTYTFVNTETGETTFEDPRLQPHPYWESINPGEIGRDLGFDDQKSVTSFDTK